MEKLSEGTVESIPIRLLVDTLVRLDSSYPNPGSGKKPPTKYVSSIRSGRTGTLGSFLDTIELVWRCILRKQVEKLSAIILGCISVAILLAEATLLPSGVALSLFSILINAVGNQEMLVQIAAFVPLMYMCMCTYYSLFKIGMLMFYSLTPRQTSSVSLLMICSMVARYAPPISYNFLNLIRLDGDAKTVFEKRMGNIDDAVPFFGQRFNKIYPLIMVIYTLLVAGNFFDRVIGFFGSWKRFKFQDEADDTDGFDPSGLIILQKGELIMLKISFALIISLLPFSPVVVLCSNVAYDEIWNEKKRSWLEQGRKVGENVIPLARNFNDTIVDVESGSVTLVKHSVEMKASSSSTKDSNKGSQTRKYDTSKEAIGNKYAVIREQQRKQASNTKSERNITSATVSLLDTDNIQNRNDTANTKSPLLASAWGSVKTGFESFKANIGTKRYLPLRQVEEPKRVSHVSSSESLDDIFQRLKQRPTTEHMVPRGDDDNDMESRDLGFSR
ncbi:hypothetical protein GIB67_031440 [Kingdonia uniflora]|uniref:LMBR1-like membrane protein n=1 Tax=Kingdonia uniflora TaxID=39325 RepID=A0A7J7MBI7_9MAGN|nr:hypothetical protein GIB67_031440 [Kingdonia uniflora]